MNEQLIGWNPIELARLYGNIWVRYAKMKAAILLDEKGATWDEYQTILGGMERLRDLKDGQ